MNAHMYALKFFLFLTSLFLLGQSSDSVEIAVKPQLADVKSVVKDYEINTHESNLRWTGKALLGEEHTGTIDLQSGMMTTEDDQVKSAKFTIDMNSIKSTDFENENISRELEGLLKSDAFFSVRHFPVSYFVVTRTSPGTKANELMVTGSLVINGVANEVIFPAVMDTEGDRVRMKAKVTIDRTRWGINYKSLSFFSAVRSGLIDAEIGLTLDLVFEKTIPAGC